MFKLGYLFHHTCVYSSKLNFNFIRRLYKALDKNDVVNGILKEQMEDNISEQLKNGIEYEQARHWIKAFKIYDVEVNRISDLPRPYDEHFILEAFCKV